MEEKENKKKIEKVITGEAKIKKKSRLIAFANRFGIIPEDLDDVKDYILKEEIIPAIKKLVLEMVDTVLNGNSGYRGNQVGGSRVSYERYFPNNGNNKKLKDNNSRSINYDEIVFPTRGDTDYTIETMCASIRRYGTVSIADLYDMAGITNFNHTYCRYGWDNERDIFNSRIIRADGGYIIKLPRPIPLVD